MPKITVSVPLRWGDMDAFGHVNNATAVQLLEQARVDGFFGMETGREIFAIVVARNEVEYLAPIPYTHEPIRVVMWLARVGGSSIEVHYEIHSPEGMPEVLHAKAATVVVFLDPESGSPRRLTPEERTDWEAYLDEPIAFRRG